MSKLTPSTARTAELRRRNAPERRMNCFLRTHTSSNCVSSLSLFMERLLFLCHYAPHPSTGRGRHRPGFVGITLAGTGEIAAGVERASGRSCLRPRNGAPDGDQTFAAVLADPRHGRSEEHTSELQSRFDLVCRLLLEKKKTE